MCGILGYALTDPIPNLIDLESWAETISHRGPDEYGQHAEEHLGFGMRRLSIIDVSNGHQPIYNENRKLIAIFNGQIYNYQELAAQLRSLGHILNSDSDGEVIVHLFEEHGPDFVNFLEGMFAIAIFDVEKKTLHLFRDRIGKKPLLYHIDDNGNLFFASELKSLLQIFPQGSNDISTESLGLYLELGYVPSPFTIFNKFKKLQPSSHLQWSNGLTKISRYATIGREMNNGSLEENKEKLKLLLTQAVAKRMISERPLGAFLSGGIDSSLVVALMSKLTEEPIKTFSVGFEHSKFDETEYASTVAQLYNTNHTEIILKDSEIYQGFSDSFNYFDEPFADSSSIATFMLSLVASNSVTVALSGDGGDESFGGYERYVILQRFARYSRFFFIFRYIKWFMLKIPALFPKKLIRLLAAAPSSTNVNSMYEAMMSISSFHLRQNLFKPGLKYLANYSHSWFYSKFEGQSASDAVMKANFYDIETYLPDDLMYKVDIASMANSLEVRSPFLDIELVQFGLSLPSDQRVGREAKVLLRELAYELLPVELIERRKMGFGSPRREWLMGPLFEDLEQIFNSDGSKIYNWFDFDSVQNVYNEFKDRGTNEGTVWTLVIFEFWARKWLND